MLYIFQILGNIEGKQADFVKNKSETLKCENWHLSLFSILVFGSFPVDIITDPEVVASEKFKLDVIYNNLRKVIV